MLEICGEGAGFSAVGPIGSVYCALWPAGKLQNILLASYRIILQRSITFGIRLSQLRGTHPQVTTGRTDCNRQT